MHTIEIKYITGDSFGSEEKTSPMEYTWTDLEMVKETLRRIKLHYDWYLSLNDRFAEPLEKPSFVDDKYGFSLSIVLDGGIEQKYGAFWIGHFERLVSAHVVLSLPEIIF